MSLHNYSKNIETEEDPLEKLMKPTGCLSLHYQVQECIAESQDWRKCRTQVANFKKCMDEYKLRQEKES